MTRRRGEGHVAARVGGDREGEVGQREDGPALHHAGGVQVAGAHRQPGHGPPGLDLFDAVQPDLVKKIDGALEKGTPTTGYGMTEVTASSTVTRPDDPPARRLHTNGRLRDVGPAGDPALGGRLVVYRVMDPETGRLVAPGEVGELQAKGPGVTAGYYNKPEATAEAFTADGWLRTGDKGSVDARGRLRITGRVKDLFKTSKGKYVAPSPIEDKLVMHMAIEACCVTGANLGQPLGLLMLNPDAAGKAKSGDGRTALESSLAEHLKKVNAQLDPHEQMDCLVITAEAWSVENDILTPTMKVKRNKIEDVFAANYEVWVGSRKKVIWA